jgi:2-oxoglutarate dehydrogenase E2 component (dihydrolipoamide succinyltransferase)
MASEIRVPTLGESVTEATVASWYKKSGDAVNADEPLVELETDKVTVEVPAPASGALGEILVKEGETVEVGTLLGMLEAGDGAAPTPASTDDGSNADAGADPKKAEPAPQASSGKLVDVITPSAGESVTEAEVGEISVKVGDAVKADDVLLELETDKAAQEIPAPCLRHNCRDRRENRRHCRARQSPSEDRRGRRRIKREKLRCRQPGDPEQGAAARYRRATLRHRNAAFTLGQPHDGRNRRQRGSRHRQARSGSQRRCDQRHQFRPNGTCRLRTRIRRAPSSADDEPREDRVRMTRLRQTIARRLKDAQNTAAMLTTYNEVDMGPVMDIRKQYKELFEKKHGVKLGFMGFFTKAVCHALKEIPAVNAEIDGTDIIYKNFAHIGVAVGTDKGLVVPVVRDADQMSIAEIEKEIGRLGLAARDGKLGMDAMQGGTFTISNGGVYGSLMSSPILNAPQSGILGMHKIQERPMAVNGQVVIRPMMYLALSYDHRIVDGKEAVTFLVRVKESLEDVQRLVLDL